MSPIATKPLVRYLRIGWTVFWLATCILLIGLWVGSYLDVGQSFTKNRSSQHEVFFEINSQRGQLLATLVSDPQGTNGVQVRKVSSGFWSLGVVVTGTISNFLVSFPYWILVTLSGVLAVAPWVRSLNWRFSLRTLLFFTTLVAVVLGVIVWAVRK